MLEETLSFLKPLMIIIVVAIAAYSVIRALLILYFTEKKKHAQSDLNKDHSNKLLPLRLQAYERLMLFLERISLDSMVNRIFQPGLSAIDYARLMRESVEQEYNHNVAQQIYVQPHTWNDIKSAKDNTLRLIDTTCSGLRPDAKAFELNEAMISQIISKQKSPESEAKESLVFEVNQFMNRYA